MIERKRTGLVIALGAVAVGYALTYIDEQKRQTPIWRYRSYPKRKFNWDAVIRTVTEAPMRIVSDGVIAHASDWMNVPFQDTYQGEFVPGDPTAFARRNFLDGVLVDTRWGWRTTYAMGVASECEEPWRLGYKTEQMEQVRLCGIEIPPGEQIRIVAGDKDVRFYALDRNLNEIPLEMIGPFDRGDKRFQHLRLL